MKQSGLLCAGNFIVDRIRMVEAWPQQDMLTSITSETMANGGGPFNILKDLVALGASFPLEAAGCVGDDADGRWIIEDCRKAGIETRQMHTIPAAPTSYTEVMCVTATGRRTFFHRRGANALFDEEHVDFTQTNAGHFHLAYLMLLDALDSPDANGRSRASLLLEKAKIAGLTTSVDIVSTESPGFVQNVQSALSFTDYLFINELEAERATGMCITEAGKISIKAAHEAALALLRGGVIVRPVAGYGLPEYLRISVGTRAQNQRLFQVLDAQRGMLW